jgi:membrane peptidoglycan carboxypeptidase
MMQGVIQYGTGAAANIGRPAAGKTGTTSDARDVWFVGFTPTMACAVWMGNDDNSRLWYGSTGGAICAPLWSRFMRYAHHNLKPKGFPEANYDAAFMGHRPGRLAALERIGRGASNRDDYVPPAEESTPQRSHGQRPSAQATPEPIEMDELDSVPPPAPAQPHTVRPRSHPKPAKTRPPKLESVINTDETLMEPGPDMPAGQ